MPQVSVSGVSKEGEENSAPDVKMPCWLINRCPVDIGDFSLHANWDFLRPRAVHLSSIV